MFEYLSYASALKAYHKHHASSYYDSMPTGNGWRGCPFPLDKDAIPFHVFQPEYNEDILIYDFKKGRCRKGRMVKYVNQELRHVVFEGEQNMVWGEFWKPIN